MTPIYFNSSFNDQHEHQFFSPSDQQNEHQFLSPNSQASSSSNSLTCHLFLNPNSHDQDGVFHKESQAPQHEGDNFRSQEYNDHHLESQGERGSNSNNGGLKFSLWKRETCNMNDENQVKWMSSKVRVMLKMKKSNPTGPNSFRSTATEVKLEDHQDHNHPRSTISPMEETANSNSINSTSSNNIPIRVCSDCNTTKTPLWRSGPQGPKSLCNACGIRQRKARKAMAAAAAAAAAETGNNVFHDKSTPLKKATKILHKDHKKPKNGHLPKYKKRLYSKQITTPSPSSSSPARRNCVEEFLVSLSKNLAFHRVFPQDEKEAAILLMALSYGYVHE